MKQRMQRLWRNQTDIDFVSWWRKGFIITSIIVVLALGSLVTRGLNLGIEFEGGVAWDVEAPGLGVDDVRDALRPIGEGDARIQAVGSDIIRVRAELDEADDPDKVAQVTAAIAEAAGVEVNQVSREVVGPSWGSDITSKAQRALIVFLVVVALYIAMRLEMKMAIAAVVALAHDVIVTVGIYSLFGFEVTSATVIAFLTILGYSLYDTMVVFDKVRRNESRAATARKLTYTELVSLSLNQVFMRTVNTTITSVMPVLMVLFVGAGILGAVTLREFGIALLVGLISGTYSSMFVAAPLVSWLKEREPENAEFRAKVGARSGGGKALRSIGADETNRATNARRERAARAQEVRTNSPTVGGHPPRPRKKKKKR